MIHIVRSSVRLTLLTFYCMTIVFSSIGPSAAMDSDSDGLSDSAERARARVEQNWISHEMPSVTANGGFVFADIDGDDDLDFITGGGSGSLVQWYRNNGDGLFVPQPALRTDTLRTGDVRAADLDSDNDLDIVYVTRNGELIWNQNLDGQGTFSPPINIDSGQPFAPYTYMVAVDIDRDTDLDLVLYSRRGRVSWYENEGSGAFGPSQEIDPGGNSLVVNRRPQVSLAAMDIDEDGDNDLLVCFGFSVFSNNFLGVYENLRINSLNPTDSFAPLRDLGVANTPQSIQVVDFNRDGTQDVLLGEARDASERAHWVHIGPDPLPRISGATIEGEHGAPEAEDYVGASAVDVDGDGDFDLVWNGPHDGTAWTENQSTSLTSNFAERRIIDTHFSGVGFPSLFGDFDGDGDADLLGSSPTSFVWFENPGTNPFDPDSDGDSVNDGDEVAAGTDPNDPNDVSIPVPVLGQPQTTVLVLLLVATGFRATQYLSQARRI